MDKNELTKSIRIAIGTHKQAISEAKKHSVSMQDYADAAVHYFASRGINPMQTVAREGEQIMGQVKQLGDRVFRYMQEQERGVHQQVLAEMVRARVTQERSMRMLAGLIGTTNGWKPTQTAQLLESAGQDIDNVVAEVLKELQAAAPGRKPRGEEGKID